MEKNLSRYALLRKNFGNKKIIFAHWDSENTSDYSYQNWYLPLKKIFGQIITFSPKKNYFRYGKEKMNAMFLDLVRKEQPDYIYFLVLYDEFDTETLVKVRQLAPRTLLINLFGDDSWRYEDFGRYYALFFDYIITTYHKAVDYHKKDGIKNVSFTVGANLDNFKKLAISKKYDVIFIGKPGNERVEYLNFLISNGIKVNIWGASWSIYPEFAHCYHGPLKAEELVKVVNESKINLSFTMGGNSKPQLKGRPFEVSACGSFSLVGYFDKYLDFFKEGKEIIMFKDKEDLLKKICYYLKNEKEREEIAKAAYTKVIKKYSLEQELIEIFSKIVNIKIVKNRNFNQISNKISYLNVQDVYSDNIQELVKNSKYISFRQDTKNLYPYKEHIQLYSLEKSGKGISCCDYYLNSPILGNYLLLKASLSFHTLPSNDFHSLLQPSQLTFTLKEFLKKLNNISELFAGKNTELIKEDNTVFISIPLLSLNKTPEKVEYSSLEKAFQMKFLDNLYALQYQKDLFIVPYALKLVFLSLERNLSLMRVLKDSLFDSTKRERLKKGF